MSIEYARDQYTGEQPSNGARVSNHAITIGGYAAAWSLVPIYDNGTLIGSVYADESGRWEYGFQPDTGLHAYTTTPDGVPFVLDVAPPVASALTSVADAYTGEPIHDGGSMADHPLAFTGTAASFAYVAIYDNGQIVASTYADVNGNWEMSLQPGAGHHAYAFNADSSPFFQVQIGEGTGPIVDPVNPVDPTDPVNPVDPTDPTDPVDPTPVVLTIDGLIDDGLGHDPHDILPGETTDNWFPLMHGTAPAGFVVNIVDRVSSKLVGVATADQNGHWEARPIQALSDGHYELYATTTGGGQSHTFSFDVEAPVIQPPVDPVDPTHPVDPVNPVDPTPPVDHSITMHAFAVDDDVERELTNGETVVGYYTTYRLDGHAMEGSSFKVVVQSGNQVAVHYVTADENGQWSVDLGLRSTGQELIRIESGGEIVETFTFQWEYPVTTTPGDQADYSVTFDGVTDTRHGHDPHEVSAGGTTANGTPLLHGTATPGAIVYILDRTTGHMVSVTTADQQGHWQATANPLQDGHHQLYATVAPDVYSEAFSFYVDSSATSLADSAMPIESPDANAPVAPMDRDPSEAPAAPDISLHVVAVENGVERELADGDSSIGYNGYNLFFRAEGHAAPGSTFQVTEWSGPWIAVHTVTADQNGHWSVDLEARASGDQVIRVVAENELVDSFTFHWDFTGADTSAGPAPELAIDDLLADHATALFADEAKTSHEPASAVHATLDVSDLGQVQHGGVSAAIAGSAPGPAIHQEEPQHV